MKKFYDDDDDEIKLLGNKLDRYTVCKVCGFHGQLKTNEWVLNKAGVKRELLDTVKARKLAYYGQTMRKQGSCLHSFTLYSSFIKNLFSLLSMKPGESFSVLSSQ